MPISHLFAEGIGPFRKIHLDLRGPDGHPSRGPHVLAGVNGSGKSTLLKAIAWCMAQQADGFPSEEWVHFLKGHTNSRVLLIFDIVGLYRFAWAVTKDVDEGCEARLTEWVNDNLSKAGLSSRDFSLRDTNKETLGPANDEKDGIWVTFAGDRREPQFIFSKARYGGPEELTHERVNAAAYSSARFVRFIERPDMAQKAELTQKKRFAFEATVQNAAIQSWLLSLYSKRAIAKERHESVSRYTIAFDALERGLNCVCGDDVSIVVDIEPSFQPSLRVGEQVLNFSQIPDGLKATLGWLADFMMRSEARNWDPKLEGRKPGLLLFDEIEGFLHPLWQRRLLPAVREALPETQSIVTSHSPFVISSSSHSVIHVLKTKADGSAYVDPPARAPFGESITSTLKEIFGVDSRFDVETEKQLNDWNNLNKIRAERKLKSSDESRFRELTRVLSARSEELRSLVSPIPKLPKATVDRLTELPSGSRTRSRRVSSR